MELVRGVPLEEYIRSRAQISTTGSRAEIAARLDLFARICDAIGYAHQRGIIHRDLKPSNILVIPGSHEGSSEGTGAGVRVKILDFGLARMTDADVTLTTMVTDVGRVQGTLPYMSPEQVLGPASQVRRAAPARLCLAEPQRAEPILRECLSGEESSENKNSIGLLSPQWANGQCLLALGRPAQAESLMVSSCRILSSTGNCGLGQKADALGHLVELYRALGKPEQAAIYEQELTKLQAERSDNSRNSSREAGNARQPTLRLTDDPLSSMMDAEWRIRWLP